jgi:hypothetical protein
MGHDGAQGVGAAAMTIERGTTKYSVARTEFVNVDARAVVCTGGPPSGAHSDIYHPELVGVLLGAAGMNQ